MVQAGFRCVIAPWREVAGARTPAFADIFAGNAVKNGLLTIELSELEVDRIFERVARTPGLEATIDLPRQTIELHGPAADRISFSMDPMRKDHLLKGLDDVDLTLEREWQIAAFEAGHDTQMIR